jgi:thiol-disulfide isomerase/thioredoxin
MGLRTTLRRFAEGIGRVVSKDALFERPGERAPIVTTEPLDAPPEGAAERIVTPLQAAREREEAARRAAVDAAASAPDASPAVAAPAQPADTVPEAPSPSVKAAPVASDAESASARPARKAPARKSKAPTPSAEAPVAPSRPKEGCIPVDEAGLRAALAPAGKPLVINHWATWCDPCIDELPRLVRAAAGVADIGEFLGVSWDLFDHPGKPATRAAEVARFADSVGVGYPSVLFTGTPEQLFAITGFDWHFIPQTLVIAPDGRVVWHKKGVVDHDDVFPLIAAVKECAR